jgi:hypothetical protein
MLDVFGQDRDMPRLAGETADNYRLRLMFKPRIAARAGTDAAFQDVARAFGYDHVVKELSPDPDKWAEVRVTLVGGGIVLDNPDLLLAELNKVKPASALLRFAKEQRYPAVIYLAAAIERGRVFEIRQI